jgi:hypothetical protein
MSILLGFEDEILELTPEQIRKKKQNKARREGYYVGELPTYDDVLRIYSEERLPSTRYQAGERGYTGGYNVTVTAFEVAEIWKMQNGLSIYSKRIMTLNPTESIDGKWKPCPTNISLDRYDSSIGYTFENVYLCCLDENTSKGQWSHSEWLENAHSIIQNKDFINQIKIEKQKWWETKETQGPLGKHF